MNRTDFLPSWSEGAAKTAILEFVESVTKPGASFVAPAERIATFDNDGALVREALIRAGRIRPWPVARVDRGGSVRRARRVSTERDRPGSRSRLERAVERMSIRTGGEVYTRLFSTSLPPHTRLMTHDDDSR
jgi:hypothetical protein